MYHPRDLLTRDVDRAGKTAKWEGRTTTFHPHLALDDLESHTVDHAVTRPHKQVALVPAGHMKRELRPEPVSQSIH